MATTLSRKFIVRRDFEKSVDLDDFHGMCKLLREYYDEGDDVNGLVQAMLRAAKLRHCEITRTIFRFLDKEIRKTRNIGAWEFLISMDTSSCVFDMYPHYADTLKPYNKLELIEYTPFNINTVDALLRIPDECFDGKAVTPRSMLGAVAWFRLDVLERICAAYPSVNLFHRMYLLLTCNTHSLSERLKLCGRLGVRITMQHATRAALPYYVGLVALGFRAMDTQFDNEQRILDVRQEMHFREKTADRLYLHIKARVKEILPVVKQN